MLAMTRWPVAALATIGAVMFVPKLTATRAARQRTAKLEGLEQWTRRLSDMLTASRGLEDAHHGQRQDGACRRSPGQSPRSPGAWLPGSGPMTRFVPSPMRSTTRQATGSPPP